MTTALIKIFLAVLVGVIDRVRGGYPEGNRPKWVKYFVITFVGPILTYMVTTELYAILASIPAGHIMWRQDNGYKGQWVDPNEWRGIRSFVGPLRWGTLSAIVICLLTYWSAKNVVVYLVALPVATLATIAAAQYLPPVKIFQLRNAWPWSELLTLTVACGLAICINFLVPWQRLSWLT